MLKYYLKFNPFNTLSLIFFLSRNVVCFYIYSTAFIQKHILDFFMEANNMGPDENGSSLIWSILFAISIYAVILFGLFTALYGSHSQSKNGLYFPNFMYFSTYFPNCYDIYFPKCEGKGSFPNPK